ncbi:alpha/beta fold hydrolase [Baekduia soli]|uniref:Alpha/beta fold hydrolase n=1 Tax=Baekduia soli TaxID=496014 RepID=A0A5B8U991_9ACTN|nr:alpha/beta fold hydrolase [Baekduia soli]QEC49547.1 alpha/beta fold hydrolase [Baekduia soli]
MVCLHGFMQTWRSWELVLPRLQRHHDVLALTLAGHAGGPPLDVSVAGTSSITDAVEAAMDEAGLHLGHLVGNSLGGFVALDLAARGRARSVVAFAPAGGWAAGDEHWRELLAMQRRLHAQAVAAAPHAPALLATAQGRRQATRLLTERFEHLPAELLAHEMLGMARCDAPALIDRALRDGYPVLDAQAIACPVRVVWGTADRILPWPEAARRLRRDWLPHADWVLLDDVGHAPQLDVPLEAAELVLGFTAARSATVDGP